MVGSAASPARPHWSEQVVDAVLAVALVPVVGIQTGNALVERGLDAPASGWLLVVALCAPVAVRRRWPVAALIVTTAAVLAAIALGLVFVGAGAMLGLPAVLVLYSVGRAEPARRAVDAALATVVGLSLLAVLLVMALPGTTSFDHIGAGGLVVAQLCLAWLVGRAVRQRHAPPRPSPAGG